MPMKFSGRLILAVAFTCLGLLTHRVMAQEGWDRYQPRTLGEIISNHRESVLETATAGVPNWIVPTNNYPSRVRVTYTGRSRPLASLKAEMIERWVTALRIDPSALEAFKTELLFQEDTTDFWLPVQEVLIPHFHEELEPGSPVLLYTLWVGAHYAGDEITWAFVVNEFSAGNM
jgi:hypothetical protein